MRKWPLILSVALILIILIFNIWVIQEKKELIATTPKHYEPGKSPFMPEETQDFKRRQETNKEIKTEKGISFSLENEISLEEEAKEAEMLQIKPTKEEMKDLEKKKIILY